MRKYYHADDQRVAVREGSNLYWLLADHLGSTSLTTNDSGGMEAEQRYYPYGEVRWSDGTLPTDFTFTGQRVVPGTGLVFMHARYYHPSLGRFVSADTVVPNPGNPQDLNRYAYVRNNPVLYRDSSGHAVDMYRNSIYGVVDDPLAEPPSPERIRETAVFLAVGVPIAVFGGPVLGDIATAGTAGVEALGWKALEWTLGHPTLAKILGLGGSLTARELADADDDEVRAAQELLDALKASEEGRILLDELDDRVMARLQQLGQAANRNEEFAVYVTQGNQMSLVQTSRYGGAPPADAAQWLLHTHFGTGVAPSGNDQVILSALGARSGQFHFSTIVDSQGNSAFFLPWPLEKWLEIQ